MSSFRQRAGGMRLGAIGRVAVLACIFMLAIPSIASAACSSARRADAQAARVSIELLQQRGVSGAADVLAMYARARRSCDDLRFVRSIAAATLRLGIPVVGARARVRGVDLIGTSVGTSAVWRFDPVGSARRLVSAPTARGAAAQRATLRAASFGSTSVTFSTDPTSMVWDPTSQSHVIALLAASPHAADRLLTGAGVRAFAAPGRMRALATLPLLEHLRIGNRVARGSERARTAAARATSRALSLRAFARVRAARARSWSRIDESWATAAQHRALVMQAAGLLRQVPHPATARVLTQLRTALRAKPGIAFDALPSAEFYPWPRDGAFDSQSVTFDVDKPVRVVLSVYAPDEQIVRTLEVVLEPGVASITWDGAGVDGATVAAGEYRYNLDATDLLGNAVRVAGLEQFRVARDTTAPTVQSASVRHVHSAGARRLVIGWEVVEVHSPRVRTWLLLQRGDHRESVQLHDSLQRATVRRPGTLASGTWLATLVFIDGSGNRTSSAAGTFIVR